MEAREYCVDLGGDLVSIHSKEQENTIRELGEHYKQTYWVGFNDRDEDGQIVWSDGTNFPDNSHLSNGASIPWGPDQPQKGECGLFNPNGEEWWDLHCTHLRSNFIFMRTCLSLMLSATSKILLFENLHSWSAISSVLYKLE